MEIHPIANHENLPDMPSATNADHDPRYYTKDEINDIVEGAAFDFFLNDTASDIGGYFVMDPSETGEAESSFSDTITGDDFLIDSFATSTSEPTFTELIIGIYSLHIHAETTVGANVKTVRLYYELYKRTHPGGVETLLITSEESSILTNVKEAVEVHGSLSSDTILDSTDRLVVKIYANIEDGDPPRNTNPLVTFYAEGNLASRFEVKTTISAFDDRYVEVTGDTMTGPLTLDSAIPVFTMNGQGGATSTITGAEGTNNLIFQTSQGFDFKTNGTLRLRRGAAAGNPWDFQDNIIQTTGAGKFGSIDVFSATNVVKIGKDANEHLELCFDETNRIARILLTDDQDADQTHTTQFDINTVSTGDDIWKFRSNGVDRMVLNSSTGLNLQALPITTTSTVTWTGGSSTATNSHIADNSQAHSDYMLNTGDTVSGNYTFSGNMITVEKRLDVDDGLNVTGTATFFNDIDVTDDSLFAGKLDVVGGVDPPYVLIDLQTKEQIVMRTRQEVPESKAGGKAIVNIIGDERIKWFIPLTGEFYGEKTDGDGFIVPTLIGTWDDGQVCYNPNSTTRYYYDRITDEIKTTTKTIYDNRFPKDKTLNRDTGEITDKPKKEK